MARFLGIDYGLARTGLAITDPEGKVVFPRATLRLDAAQGGKRKAMLDEIGELARREGVDAIVVGLPRLADGSESLTCRQTRNFVKRLKRRVDAPVYFMPELLSSEEAWQDLRDAGLKPAKRRELLDQQAACRILSSFLALPLSQRIEA